MQDLQLSKAVNFPKKLSKKDLAGQPDSKNLNLDIMAKLFYSCNNLRKIDKNNRNVAINIIVYKQRKKYAKHICHYNTSKTQAKKV